MKHIKERLIAGLVITVILSVIALLSCKKESTAGKNCWRCHIICTMAPARTFDTTICRDDNKYPFYADGNGNDCSASCQKQ